MGGRPLHSIEERKFPDSPQPELTAFEMDIEHWFDARAFPSVAFGKKLDANLTKQKRPEWNGLLLKTPPGIIWQVIFGQARGFPSKDVFERIHYWSKHQSQGGWGNTVHVKIHEISSIDAIEQGPPFTGAVGLVKHPSGVWALREHEWYKDKKNNNQDRYDYVLYGIPSKAVFLDYQFKDFATNITEDDWQYCHYRGPLQYRE